MATTKGERRRVLRDFLKDSFCIEEFEIFLSDHGHTEVADSVKKVAAGEMYFFDAIEALDHRGLIDGKFFDRLTTARPAKAALIRGLRELWLESVTPDQEVEVSVSRLRHHAGVLIGREAPLARLDAAWASDSTRVVVVHAWGGVGKTSWVATWRAAMALKDWDGARRVFDWSFYNMGTRPEGDAEYQGASSDRFFAEALKFFGDPDPLAGSPWDKGARLAKLVARERSLLILDGLEPLQYPPGHEGGLAGQLKDPALAALLKGLAERPHDGLCVVTSRQSVTDLEANREKTVMDWGLGRLDETAGAELLTHLGVTGSSSDMKEVSRAVRGHALTLRLLGAWLKKAHKGDIRKWQLVQFEKADARTQGGRAFKVMKAYEDWLESAGEDGRRQFAILRLVGLFDRPADPGCLQALRDPPAIPGLTDILADLVDEDWEATVNDLEELGLLAGVLFDPEPVKGYDQRTADRVLEADRRRGQRLLPEPRVFRSAALRRGDALEAHPLVRDYFLRQMRERSPESCRDAHRRLFEHLCRRVPYWPEGLAGIEPLYEAVAHGCRAGLYQDALEAVYMNRIQRGAIGSARYYSIYTLGAFAADLGALACFFTEPWRRLEPSLGDDQRAFLLSMTGYSLGALGRLTEALEPMRASKGISVAKGNWPAAAQVCHNLGELELTLGDIASAEADATQAVRFADLDGVEFLRMAARTTLADALHQSGRRGGEDGAEAVFREAERIQAAGHPEYPWLYTVRGYRFCDLLLSPIERIAWAQTLRLPVSDIERSSCALRETLADVRRRAVRALRIAQASGWLLDSALDDLTLGRAEFFKSLFVSEPEANTARDAARHQIAAAADGLRAAGNLQYIPRGLLASAWLSHVDGDTAGAESDLNGAWEIAERGPMPLYQADILLHRARLFSDRTALAHARELIERHGYHRRDHELHDAETALGSA